MKLWLVNLIHIPVFKNSSGNPAFFFLFYAFFYHIFYM